MNIRDMLDGIAVGPEPLEPRLHKPELLPSESKLLKMRKADLVELLLDIDQHWRDYVIDLQNSISEDTEYYEELADIAWVMTARMPA